MTDFAPLKLSSGLPTKMTSSDTVPLVNLLNISLTGLLGDGSDGAIAFDGTTTNSAFCTTTGAAPNLVYTLRRCAYGTSPTVSAGITVNTGGHAIYCTGTFTNSGTVSFDGLNGVLAVGGASTSQMFAQGTGATATTGVGVNSSSNTACIGSSAGNGGAGGSGAGGTAGTASATSYLGNSAARNLISVTRSTLILNGQGRQASSTGAITGVVGGTGGASGAGDGTRSGGGGGSGGGVVLVAARVFAGTGTFTANGGNGGNGGVGGNCGGGGGGGAGAIVLWSASALPAYTYTTNGGTHGNLTGTGVNGSDGTTPGSPNTYLILVI